VVAVRLIDFQRGGTDRDVAYPYRGETFGHADRAHPFATLLAVVSAILIVVSRVNRDLWWANWIAVTGIAVLVVAAAVFLLARR